MTARDLDGAAWHFECFRQCGYKFFVCRSFDGWGVYADAQSAVMLSRNPAARCARHNAHFKADSIIILKAFDQTLDLSSASLPGV